jgi:hypothetical protein
MTTTTAMTIDLANVASTYTGSHGCCCGCNGKHRFASAWARLSSENRGYAVSDEEISDRSVAQTVRKVEQIAAGELDGFIEFVNAGFVSAETDTRTYVVYFAERDPAFADSFRHLAQEV